MDLTSMETVLFLFGIVCGLCITVGILIVSDKQYWED